MKPNLWQYFPVIKLHITSPLLFQKTQPCIFHGGPLWRPEPYQGVIEKEGVWERTDGAARAASRALGWWPRNGGVLFPCSHLPWAGSSSPGPCNSQGPSSGPSARPRHVTHCVVSQASQCEHGASQISQLPRFQGRGQRSCRVVSSLFTSLVWLFVDEHVGTPSWVWW